MVGALQRAAGGRDISVPQSAPDQGRPADNRSWGAGDSLCSRLGGAQGTLNLSLVCDGLGAKAEVEGSLEAAALLVRGPEGGCGHL